MKNAGLEVSVEAALMVMIFREVRPQKVARIGQALAKIESHMSTMLHKLK